MSLNSSNVKYSDLESRRFARAGTFVFARYVLTVGDGRPRIVQAGFDPTIVPDARYGTGLLLMPDVTLAFGV
jgi:hypothetical protein